MSEHKHTYRCQHCGEIGASVAPVTNQQIITTAVEKATRTGWWPDDPRPIWMRDGIVKPELWPVLIFHHDFAKALWGEARPAKVSSDGETSNITVLSQSPSWQHHLQQMVIAPDPIKYLGEHI